MSDLPLALFNKKVLDLANISSSASSDVLDIKEVRTYSMHLIWASASGISGDTLILQASNDGVNFVNIDSTILTGAAGQKMTNVELPGYAYIKVAYTQAAASAGTLQVFINAKR
jgi:hypothetical protein